MRRWLWAPQSWLCVLFVDFCKWAAQRRVREKGGQAAGCDVGGALRARFVAAAHVRSLRCPPLWLVRVPICSGYYLHGQSPDINAGDGTLATINELLRREATNQLQERALPQAVSSGLKDCLSYEIYVPPTVRDKYRMKLLNAVENQKAGGGAGGISAGAAEADRRMEEAARTVAEARTPAYPVALPCP